MATQKVDFKEFRIQQIISQENQFVWSGLTLGKIDFLRRLVKEHYEKNGGAIAKDVNACLEKGFQENFRYSLFEGKQ